MIILSIQHNDLLYANYVYKKNHTVIDIKLFYK